MPVKLENYTRAMTSDPQWLTREEIRAWLTLAGLVESLPTVLSAQLKQDAGINNFDYMVLSCISDTPHQTVHMSDLAVFVGGSISRLSHTLTKMENRGWVRRRPDTDNGRFTEVALTQEGKDVVAQAAPGHVREVRRVMIDVLGHSQTLQLGTLLDQVLAAVNPDVQRVFDERFPDVDLHASDG